VGGLENAEADVGLRELQRILARGTRSVTKSLAPELRPAGNGRTALATTTATPPAAWEWPKPQRGFAWSRYLEAVRRYKWSMALVIVLVTLLGILASRLVRPEYTVRSTIWIAPETNGENSAVPVRANEVLHQAAWPELLTSSEILNRVARRTNLYIVTKEHDDIGHFAGAEPREPIRPGNYSLRVSGHGTHFQLSTSKGDRIQAGTVGDSIGSAIGLRWRPATLGPDREVRFALIPPRAAAVALKQGLAATLPEQSNLLQVTLQGPDPTRITTVMSALLDEFITAAAALKKRSIVEVVQTLKQQLDLAARDLHDTEVALEGFRVRTITLPSEPRVASSTDGNTGRDDAINARFFAQQAAYDAAQRARVSFERAFAAVHADTLDVSGLNALPEVRDGAPELSAALRELADREAQLADARRRFTDAHPVVAELVRQVRDLREHVIPRHADALARLLRMRENDLRDQVESSARVLRDVPARSMEEARLRRELATRENLFSRVKTQYEEATIAAASMVPDVSVLDAPSLPDEPSRNRRPLIIALGFFLSLIAAAALAYGLDRWDPRFRYPEQASDELGLEIIGAVPKLQTKVLRNPAEAAQSVEAFRTLRLNLAQIADSTGRVLVTLTSPNAGDGKSLIAANLAQSFAEAGHRTLLIDGDIRRGELDKRFGVDRAPGLLDYIDGRATLEQVLRSTTSDLLWVMPRGASHARGPELLVSPVVPSMITELQRRYEVIIVDSSPLGAGIDPFVLGSATGNMVLVLRAGESNRKLAEAKLKLLARLPIRIVGVVLNNVHLRGDFQYYAYSYQDFEQTRQPTADSDSRINEFARRSGLSA
jgi:capsular exopolysaccharide synthesis family protein